MTDPGRPVIGWLERQPATRAGRPGETRGRATATQRSPEADMVGDSAAPAHRRQRGVRAVGREPKPELERQQERDHRRRQLGVPGILQDPGDVVVDVGRPAGQERERQRQRDRLRELVGRPLPDVGQDAGRANHGDGDERHAAEAIHGPDHDQGQLQDDGPQQDEQRDADAHGQQVGEGMDPAPRRESASELHRAAHEHVARGQGFVEGNRGQESERDGQAEQQQVAERGGHPCIDPPSRRFARVAVGRARGSSAIFGHPRRHLPARAGLAVVAPAGTSHLPATPVVGTIRRVGRNLRRAAQEGSGSPGGRVRNASVTCGRVR